MRRRDFLAAAAAAGALPLSARASSSVWGGPPNRTAEGLLLPKGVRAERVLEVYLYGGLGPFESFYAVEEYGRPDDPDYPNEQWYLFESTRTRHLRSCDLPEEEPLLAPFGVDSLGMTVNFGPLVMPLRLRPDVLARTRVLVQRHTLEPHEAAIPYALSGHRLGSARLAGLGAHAQRFHLERDASGRRVPYAYVLYPEGEISTDNLRAASAVGFHPGATRPLDLRITRNSDLPALLAREILGGHREAYDALVAHYTARAQDRYTLGGEALRARALTDHAFATEVLQNAEGLREVFSDEMLASVQGSSCGTEAFSSIATGLSMGAHLLTHPDAPARYVTVVDGGLRAASGGGGYDVHTDHLQDTARNLIHTLDELLSRVNEPGEGDPSKIDLDDTMIVLNTEFGRTPYTQNYTGDGTNHHPYGYVTALIGGPIREDEAGVLGAIGRDGFADRYVTPAESRAAVLAAMGIYPFTHESFAVGDLRELYNENDGLAWLNEIVLGRRS